VITEWHALQKQRNGRTCIRAYLNIGISFEIINQDLDLMVNYSEIRSSWWIFEHHYRINPSDKRYNSIRPPIKGKSKTGII